MSAPQGGKTAAGTPTAPAQTLVPLDDAAIGALTVLPAGTVSVRRDVYVFVDFVRRAGIKRSHRGNGIPKPVALKLASALSWAGEADRVARDGHGHWSDSVSRIARELGLVSFDTEGVYAGYSSQEPSFPDNFIKVDEKRWTRWLGDSPSSKERAILDALIKSTPNEFFHGATLIGGRRFDTFGSAVGPASRMDLPRVRRGLLELLAGLPVGVWLPTKAVIELLSATAPTLILDPALRQPPDQREAWAKRMGRPAPSPEDLYSNFREATVGDPWSSRSRPQLTERTPDVFSRVEGRYLQFFLQEIPHLCGFVDLALPPPRKERPDDAVPALDQVHAFRVSPRLRQVLHAEPELSRVSVTVLANFDVLLEAPSYPDREVASLSPVCKLVKEDGPTHLLRLDRGAVTTFAAASATPVNIKDLLERLSGRPLPANVAAELDAWCSHAEKLVVYENVALVALHGDEALRKQVRGELGELVVDDRVPGFLVVRDPARVVSVLEQRQRVPVATEHGVGGFVEGPAGLGDGLRGDARRPGRRKAEPRPSVATPRQKARLIAQDIVSYRADTPELLRALHGLLEKAGAQCDLVEKGARLLVPATDLGHVRACLERLQDRYDVDLGR